MKLCGILTLFLLLNFNMAAFCSDHLSSEQLVRQISMPNEFTVRYHVVEKDVRPPDMRKFLSDYFQKAVAFRSKERKNGTQTRSDDHNTSSSILHIDPPNSYLVTMSERHGKIFLMRESEQQKSVIAYDGQFTFVYTKRKDEPYGNAQILPGFSAISMTVLPLPAAGMDVLPLLREVRLRPDAASSQYLAQGLSPVFNRGSAPTVPYLPSETRLTASGKTVKVLDCILKDPDGATNQRWDYHDYVSFHSVWLARDMSFTDYQSYFVGMSNLRKPSTIFTYKLLGVSASAVPPDYFNCSTWLKNHDSVQDSSGGRRVGFEFHKGEGDLERQITRGLWEQQKRTSQIENGDFVADRTGGVFVLAAVIGLLGAWTWRARGGKAGNKSHD